MNQESTDTIIYVTFYGLNNLTKEFTRSKGTDSKQGKLCSSLFFLKPPNEQITPKKGRHTLHIGCLLSVSMLQMEHCRLLKNLLKVKTLPILHVDKNSPFKCVTDTKIQKHCQYL